MRTVVRGIHGIIEAVKAGLRRPTMAATAPVDVPAGDRRQARTVQELAVKMPQSA